MSASVQEIAAIKAEIEQALSLMRTQMAAFRRTAAPEVMAAYPRITAAVGRKDFVATRKRSKAGLKEVLDEAELLAWDVPQILERLFTDDWMQACFTANDTYPETTAYKIYDYLRGRGKPDSPFPSHFHETLQGAFVPLARMLKRSGFDTAHMDRIEHVDRGTSAPFSHPKVANSYRMNPVLVSGATLFGEQARRCHDLRSRLKVLELKFAEEDAAAKWDELEAERRKRP